MNKSLNGSFAYYIYFSEEVFVENIDPSVQCCSTA